MKTQHWQSHIDACKKSGQSKKVYAEKQGLVYAQFLYWARKLSSSSAPAYSDFVPVTIKPKVKPATHINSLGVLEFPNGIKLTIHSHELFANIPSLWKR